MPNNNNQHQKHPLLAAPLSSQNDKSIMATTTNYCPLHSHNNLNLIINGVAPRFEMATSLPQDTAWLVILITTVTSRCSAPQATPIHPSSWCLNDAHSHSSISILPCMVIPPSKPQLENSAESLTAAIQKPSPGVIEYNIPIPLSTSLSSLLSSTATDQLFFSAINGIHAKSMTNRPLFLYKGNKTRKYRQHCVCIRINRPKNR